MCNLRHALDCAVRFSRCLLYNIDTKISELSIILYLDYLVSYREVEIYA